MAILIPPPDIYPVGGATGDPARVQVDSGFDVSPMATPGTVLFEEPMFGSGPFLPVLGMWNDGAAGASASLDSVVPFSGRPTIKLDLQGCNTPGITDPEASPDIDGVVFKRRLQFPVAGVYSAEMWIRWTSPNQTNTFTTLSLYNRDGTNGYYGRLWLKNTVTPVELYYLSTAGTYTLVTTINMQTSNHLFDPSSNRLDKAGQWTFVKLYVDFTNLNYVGFQVDQYWYDLTGIPIYSVASSGARAMHFSIEFNASTATEPRYIHIARVIGRRYS